VSRPLAAIDLGTNTVRVLVVEAPGSGWYPVHEEQRVTRLGEGQAAAGVLQPIPMTRTAATVAEFVRRARSLGVDDVRIVATSAVREAANGRAFAELVRTLAGRELHVISGEEEARLTLLGVSSGLPMLGGSFLLFDVGGGSTEIVVARGGTPIALLSLRLGVVELAERFLGPGPGDPKRHGAMTAEIEAKLSAHEVPVGIVRTLEELTEDPHLKATGFFSEREHPTEGPVLTFASPLDFEKTKTAFRRHAPRVGEDGVEVLREAGLGDAQIEALRAGGALVLP